MSSKQLWEVLNNSKDEDIFTIITMSIVYLVMNRKHKLESICNLVKGGVERVLYK